MRISLETGDMRFDVLGRSLPCSSNGEPSFVHVYWMFAGLPDATRPITSDSSSMPTAVEDGGGVNFGGSDDEIRA